MEDTCKKITKTSFELIYRTYWKKIFGICLYRVGDEHIAEEIVQDIFQSLWEKRHQFELRGPIEHYLVRAAKLEIMDYFRTGSRRKVIRNEIFSGYSEADHTTEARIHQRDLQQHIENLVERLPAHARAVYQCSREEGLNNRETAERLSISIKTVEYHLTRALQFLRTNLQEYKV